MVDDLRNNNVMRTVGENWNACYQCGATLGQLNWTINSNFIGFECLLRNYLTALGSWR